MSLVKDYEKRIAICEACPHYSSIGTCGTPIVGDVIIHNGFEMKLCGCFMKVKARIPFLSCPLDKWQGELNEKDRIALYEFLKDAKKTSRVDSKTLIAWWNKAYPQQAKKVTYCDTCVTNIVNELWVKVKDHRPPSI